MAVYVVNRSRSEAMETSLQLTSGVFKGRITASTINGPDIKAENTFTSPHEVKAKETAITGHGQTLNYSFEPHSVTALLCDIA
jgi:alpha-L-arabinofuranosidase